MSTADERGPDHHHVLPEAPAPTDLAAACVDTDVLAAWVDGRLPTKQASHLKAHVAQCGRCQAIAAALGETSSVPASGPSFWWRWRLAWQLPTIVLAAAILVYAVTRLETKPIIESVQSRAESIRDDAVTARPVDGGSADAASGGGSSLFGAARPASAPAPLATTRTLPSGAGPRGERSDGAAGASTANGGGGGSQSPRSPASIGPSTVALSGSGAAAPTANAGGGGTRSPERLATVGPATVALSGNATAAPAADAGGGGSQPPRRTASSSGSAPVARSGTAAAAPTTNTGGGVGGQSPPSRASIGPATVALSGAGDNAPLEVRSRSGGRWRVTSNGGVEYSTDNGLTWHTSSVISAGVRAGASPSPGVCWLVGAAGAVWLTTNGTTFVRLAPPETTLLIAVVATDASSATVTTIDGRSFRTTNAGGTWILQGR